MMTPTTATIVPVRRNLFAAALLLCALATLAGCGGGGGGSDSAPDTPTTMRKGIAAASAVPPGDTCKYGGTKVNSGLDNNGNGVLDDTEVTATNYVCNGSPGSN